MKKEFQVDPNFINSRLDRWIRKNVCNIPQSLIEKSIRKGKIKINNKRAKSSHKLRSNDQITLYNFNFSNNKSQKRTYIYSPTKHELSSASNIFIENNENFAVINKPAGIAVQPGTKSIRNILDILRNTKEFEGFTPYTVHRIDKETTGVLIIAKNRKYAQLFTSLFRIKKIHKTYLCVVLGELEKRKETLTDVLFNYEGEKKVKTKAITHYKVLDSNSNYSLLKINPETGRKHQIRKQLLIHGHPILGDTKYRISKKKLSKKNILMLHAYKIHFLINGVKYNFLAEPSFDFKKTLKEKFLKIY